MVITMRDKLIQLVTVKGNTKDRDGFVTREDISTIEIWAEEKSVGRTEYYEAMRNGLRVDTIFSVDPEDFELGTLIVNEKKIRATKVIYEGTTYKIERTYKSNMHSLEMTCKEVE